VPYDLSIVTDYNHVQVRHRGAGIFPPSDSNECAKHVRTRRLVMGSAAQAVDEDICTRDDLVPAPVLIRVAEQWAALGPVGKGAMAVVLSESVRLQDLGLRVVKPAEQELHRPEVVVAADDIGRGIHLHRQLAALLEIFDAAAIAGADPR